MIRKGLFRFKIKRNNKIVYNDTIFNTITALANDEMISALLGEIPDMEIKYMAFGDGTTAVTVNDLTLDNEIYRQAITSIEASSTGEVTSEFLVAKATTFTGCTEIGIFGGSEATATADTGLLIARVLLSSAQDKVLNDEWYFQRVDSLGGG